MIENEGNNCISLSHDRDTLQASEEQNKNKHKEVNYYANHGITGLVSFRKHLYSISLREL